MTKINPATHGPGGHPHPQFILNYIAVFRANYPSLPLPQIWDRRNGWVQFDGRSARMSEIVALTERGAAGLQCPHGEQLGKCADCDREHREATR